MWNDPYLGPMECEDRCSKMIKLESGTAVAACSTENVAPQPDDSDSSDEDVEAKAWEWRRLYLADDGGYWDILCCPEDVEQTAQCKHGDTCVSSNRIVCKRCQVPVCADCYEYIRNPPLYAAPCALTNDNVIGYTYKTILKYKVRWIEAAAAQPAWTTMMCFYIEGDRGHLMEEYMFEGSYMPVVRGNVFSYHMPWEKIMQSLDRSTSDEKLALLPHDPEHLAHMVQLHLKIGRTDLAKLIKEIKVRAHVVLKLGYDLIRARHAAYVETGGATTSRLVRRMRQAKASLKQRVKKRYPSLATEEDEDGVVPAAVLEKLSQAHKDQDWALTLQQDKNATPSEGATSLSHAFDGERPKSLIEERTSDAGLDVAAQRIESLRQYTPLAVNVEADYVKQWNSLYVAQVLPFTFPYMTGGPEYFNRSEESRRNFQFDPVGEYYEQFNLTRLPGCPKVSSLSWTRAMAHRVEAQILADWTAIPIMRNLAFRHQMYVRPSLKFQHGIETADALAAQARELCDAACQLYHKLWHGFTQSRTGTKRYINGDITKLRYAHGLSQAEQKLLHNIGFIARTLSGSQELRLQMGHCLTGAGIVYGDGVFITISPSERHSGLVLRLLRKRANDPWLKYGDADLKQTMRKLAREDEPLLEAQRLGRECAAVELPEYKLRRQAMSNDVLCCVEAFQTLVRVVLATLLGIRMCPKCPHCNATDSQNPCQDQFGSNMQPLGGIFGGCDGFGGAVESQRGATLHLHMMAYIVSAFQHHSLEEIGELIQAKLLSVDAIAKYLEWVSMHENLDQELHDKTVDDLEEQWKTNYSHPSNDALAFLPEFITADTVPTLWDEDNSSIDAAAVDAQAYMKAMRADGQFVLSRTNHHIHFKDEKTGERVPLNACIAKSRKKRRSKNASTVHLGSSS